MTMTGKTRSRSEVCETGPKPEPNRFKPGPNRSPVWFLNPGTVWSGLFFNVRPPVWSDFWLENRLVFLTHFAITNYRKSRKKGSVSINLLIFNYNLTEFTYVVLIFLLDWANFCRIGPVFGRFGPVFWQIWSGPVWSGFYLQDSYGLVRFFSYTNGPVLVPVSLSKNWSGLVPVF